MICIVSYLSAWGQVIGVITCVFDLRRGDGIVVMK